MGRDLLTRQVIVAGQVVDGVTGGAVRVRPRIAVLRQADGVRAPGLEARTEEGGLFAVSGDPAVVLPPTAAAVLRIEVEAEGYSSGSAPVAYTVAELQRREVVLALGGRNVAASVIPGMPRRVEVTLRPRPVALRGRVGTAEPPSQPIAGATVRITVPVAMDPVQTDAEGYFLLPELPVAAEATLEISAAGHRDASFQVRPDYAEPVNFASYSLDPA